MLALTIGYTSTRGNAEPVVLYCGRDAAKAKEVAMTPGEGIVRTQLFHNPIHSKSRIHGPSVAAPETPALPHVEPVDLAAGLTPGEQSELETIRREFTERLGAVESEREALKVEVEEKSATFDRFGKENDALRQALEDARIEKDQLARQLEDLSKVAAVLPVEQPPTESPVVPDPSADPSSQDTPADPKAEGLASILKDTKKK